MTLEIRRLRNLPCELEIFKINGIDADQEDFGEGSSNLGDVFSNSCSHKFIPYKRPTEAVLRKYGITESEYAEICDRLEEELYVSGCGLCS